MTDQRSDHSIQTSRRFHKEFAYDGKHGSGRGLLRENVPMRTSLLCQADLKDQFLVPHEGFDGQTGQEKGQA